MKNDLDINLFKRLNDDVILNHIIPYTYNTQPSELLFDIKNFYSELSIIENAYTYDYNYYILFYDLINFCNQSVTLNYNLQNRFETILRRNFNLSSKSYSYLNNLVFIHFYRDVSLNMNRKLRFVWALLTPNERMKFIRRFLLDENI